MPKVAILLPVFNGERYLAAAIDSVLAQSFEDFELLIADDVSTDNSAQIIAKYAQIDRRIKSWKNTENKGLFGNYNQCLSRASGQYIKPFAQDDLIEPEMLAHMVAVLDADKNLVLASCARRCVDDQGNETEVLREFADTVEFDFNQVIKDNLVTLRNRIGEPSAVIFRQEFAGDGFDDSFYHLGDIEYWFRIIEHGKYIYVNEVLCSFRQHAASTTSKNAKGLRFALDMVRLGNKYVSHIEQAGLSEEGYLRLVAETTASHLKYLSRHKGVCLADLLAVEHETPEQAIEDLKVFKKILFYALLIAGETIEENGALKEEWQADRYRLEDNIAKLFESRSWKITTPLRNAVKALRTQI